MANVSQQRVQTLTQTASQTPQFQPSPDPVQAGLSAVQMGLDFYRKQQAQEELASLEQAQSQRQRTVAEGVLGLRELRSSLAAQGASAVKIAKAEAQFLKPYSPELATEVIGSTNKLTGGSRSDTISEAEAVEKAKFDKQNTAAGMSGFMPKPPDPSATDEELDSYILRAESIRSGYQARQTKAAVQAAETSNSEQKRRIRLRSFGDTLGTFLGADISKLVNTAINNTDMSDPAARKEMIAQLRAERVGLPDAIREIAGAQGDLSLTSEERASFQSRFDSTIDQAIKFLESPSAAKVDKAFMTEKFNNILYDAFSSDDKKTRASAASVMMSLSSDIPVSPLALENIELVGMKALAEGTSDEVDDVTGEPEVEQSSFDAAVGFIGGLFSGSEEATPAQKKYNIDLTLNNLTGSEDKLNSPRQKKVMTKLTEAIGNSENIDNVIPSGQKQSLSDILKSQMQPRLVSTLSAFMEERPSVAPPSSRTRVSTQAPEFVARGGDRYSFDPKTLEVRPTDPSATMSTRAAAWNKVVKDTFNAYEKLGTSPEQMEVLRERIRNAVGFNPESENGS